MKKSYILFTAFLISCFVISCSDRYKNNHTENNMSIETKSTRVYESEILDYEKIYLLSNIYEVDVEKIKIIITSYFNEVPLLDLEGSFKYNELIEEISVKNGVSKKLVSEIILSYNNDFFKI